MKTGRGRGRVGKKVGQSAKKKPQTNDSDGTIHPDGQEFPPAPQFSLSRDVLDREDIPPISAKNIPLELQVLFFFFKLKCIEYLNVGCINAGFLGHGV